MSPVGVLGREPPFVTVRRLGVLLVGDAVLPFLPERPRPDRLGILDDDTSSVLSSDKLLPCLEGGLLPGLLPVREAGRELDLEPPGVVSVLL